MDMPITAIFILNLGDSCQYLGAVLFNLHCFIEEWALYSLYLVTTLSVTTRTLDYNHKSHVPKVS